MSSLSPIRPDPRPERRPRTPLGEQRHPGKQGLALTRQTKLWEPTLPPEYEKDEPHSEDVSRESSACAQDDPLVLRGLPLALVILGVCLAVFLVSVDRTIITTAIPDITAEFQSTSEIGWYGSAYLLTACAFQPIFGRIYGLFPVKWPYLVAIALFMLGSLICGVAPNSPVLIIGRAIAGFGSAGILTGSFVIIASAIPLRLRPVYTAAVGIMFGFGATVGPLLGGVFVDLAGTWRWCFYVNLPVGACTMAVILLFFRNSTQQAHQSQTILHRLKGLDLVGNILLLGAFTMLFMALEDVSAGHAWSTPRIIGLLCGFGVMMLLFIIWQWRLQDRALVPPSIICQRTVAAACVFSFFIYGALLIHSYFLSVWFQAIRGASAVVAGVNIIPYVVVNAFFSLLSGIVVSVVGYFTPPAIAGAAVATIGSGILTLLSVGTSTAQWAAFEAVAAAGLGMCIQQGFTAVQAVVGDEKMAIATAAVVAAQSLGGATFLSVGNSVFLKSLEQTAAGNAALNGIDVKQIVDAGATEFWGIVPADRLPALLDGYNGALQKVFIAAIPLAGLALVATCFFEMKSVKATGSKGQTEKAEVYLSGRV